MPIPLVSLNVSSVHRATIRIAPVPLPVYTVLLVHTMLPQVSLSVLNVHQVQCRYTMPVLSVCSVQLEPYSLRQDRHNVSHV
jgi:hypothetical protein